MPSPVQTLSPAAPHLYEEHIFRQEFPLPFWFTALLILTFAVPFLCLYRFRRLSLTTRIGLWLLPWLPFLLLGVFVYGTFQPGFFIDDGPFWSQPHPMVSIVFPFLGLGSIIAFLVGAVLTIITIIKRFLVKRLASA
jgi:uncharacterized membrane protein